MKLRRESPPLAFRLGHLHKNCLFQACFRDSLTLLEGVGAAEAATSAFEERMASRLPRTGFARPAPVRYSEERAAFWLNRALHPPNCSTVAPGRRTV